MDGKENAAGTKKMQVVVRRKIHHPSYDGIKKSVCMQQLPLAILPLQQAQMAPFIAMMHPHPSYYAPVPPHIHHMPHASNMVTT